LRSTWVKTKIFVQYFCENLLTKIEEKATQTTFISKSNNDKEKSSNVCGALGNQDPNHSPLHLKG
jgi:hypothetical protein